MVCYIEVLLLTESLSCSVFFRNVSVATGEKLVPSKLMKPTFPASDLGFLALGHVLSSRVISSQPRILSSDKH